MAAGNFFLSNLRTADDLKKLVIERWDYTPTPSLPFSYNFQPETEGKIYAAEQVAEHAGYQIFYFRLNEKARTEHQSIEQFLRSTEREIISQIPKKEQDNKLYIFSSKDGGWWHFVNVELLGSNLKLKRYAIEPDNRHCLHTACERLDKIKIEPATDITLHKVRLKHEEAFRVEVLTLKFFTEFGEVFNDLKKHLLSQQPDIDDAEATAHLFTHQLLNRILFLYFVQKRGCFAQKKNFMALFWNTYRDNHEDKNEFYNKWLKILFFEALNKRFTTREYLKITNSNQDFNRILMAAPFLNGGLFTKTDLDSVAYNVEDSYFIKLFDFLESYNFTVQESTPLDQDLSIDPEMLGNIYEMLVNVTDQQDEQHTAGIFYTPKVEIDFMLRRALVEFLAGKAEISKEDLFHFVFGEINNVKSQKELLLTQKKRDRLLTELNEITLVDPACGSGHYLVVASQILYDLKESLLKHKGKNPNKFSEKKQIIEKSIYGVDVKKWAVEVAKLRLWLDLFINAQDEQFLSPEPLLPKLAFKVRAGDSMVQEVAGQFFSPGKISGLPNSLRAYLNQLKDMKRAFYNNEANVYENQIRGREKAFFDALLEEKIKELMRQKEQKEMYLQEGFQKRLLATRDDEEPTEQSLGLKRKKEKQVAVLEEKISGLRKQKTIIAEQEDLAFWPIEFADVFAEKDGFDIVVANPPYVRQEKIQDPFQQDPNLNQRREYKRKLEKQLQADWNDITGQLIDIPKRSDLYVYFYLKGLKLLNPDGVLCYISSNSWLDVQYGAALQEILLQKAPIVAIYDNQSKRSFKHADVNTVIVLLKAPKKNIWDKELKANTVRFVMFKKPFEEIATADNFIEIEKYKKRTENENYKVFPINQLELWEAGAEEPKDGKKSGITAWEYSGNKWGGKYLRAPEIYWKILEKAGDKLVRLGDIAEVRFGIKTGANEFFYVEDVTDKLED